MNLDFFKTTLIETTCENLSWKDDSQDSVACLGANVYFDGLRTGGFATVMLYDDGALFVNFSFGGINLNRDTLTLVNKFNSSSFFVKAHICENEDGNFLRLSFEVPKCVDERNAVELVLSAINAVNNDNNVRYLEPLITISY